MQPSVPSSAAAEASEADETVLAPQEPTPESQHIDFVPVAGAMEFSGRLIARPIQAGSKAAARLSSAALKDRQAAAHRAVQKYRVADFLEGIDSYLIEVPPDAENATIRRLMQTGNFDYVEPDWLLQPTACPNDPLFSRQWHHSRDRMRSCDAWGIHVGRATVGIAICDTGIRTTHEDLRANRREGYNAVQRRWEFGGGDISPVHPHGTQTTACAAANGNNRRGIAGVGWTLSHRMMRVSDNPKGTAYLSTLVHAATVGVQAGDRVISISYGGANTRSALDVAKYVKSRGGLVVWSAGNGNQRKTFGPRDGDDLIVVGATDPSDRKAWFSDYGPFVDLAAPGQSIYTAHSAGDTSYASVNGTSFSCPIVAGACGLIWSANPQLSPSAVESLLKRSCDDLGASGVDDIFGHGRLNLFKAVDAAVKSVKLSRGTYVLPLGRGCGGASGAPTIANIGVPEIGKSMRIEVRNARPNTLAALLHGHSNTNWGAIRLPFQFAGPCQLLVSPDIPLGLRTDARGTGGVNLLIPNQRSFLGTRIFDQFIVADPTAPAGHSWSPAGMGVVGISAPNPPSGLRAAEIRVGSATLAWTDQSNDEVQFRIYRSVDGVRFARIAAVPANTTSYRVANLTACKRYWFRVRAVDRNGLESKDSNTLRVDVRPLTPAAPTNLRPTLVKAQIVDLAWRDTNPTELGFAVFLSRDGRNFSQVATTGRDVHTVRINNLTRLTDYWFKVRVLRQCGVVSPFSNVIHVKTKDTLPAAPSNLRAVDVRRKQVDLRWRDNSNNETAFRIKVSRDGRNWGPAGQVAANQTAYTVTELLRKTTYYIMVRSYNTAGTRDSNVIRITTN